MTAPAMQDARLLHTMLRVRDLDRALRFYVDQLGMRLLPVPRGPDGPDLAVMAQLLEQHRPRLYVTVSVLHNPTGASLSLQSAHKVLQLAHAHDFAIVEDDTYAHLAPAHLPRLAALDALERTIYVSGFSKILTPSWRVGFIAAPTRWIEPPWKAILSNKGILPLLWEMFPNHPNLLPAYFEDDPEAARLGTSFVRKPIYSREGANVALVASGEVFDEQPGPYGTEGFIRQQLTSLGNFSGQYPVLGSWVVNGTPCGLSIREDENPITGNSSRFIPHAIL